MGTFRPADTACRGRHGRRGDRGRRGALLVDVMVAMFVSLLIILGCVALAMSASSAADAARQNNLAVNAARQVLENLRGYGGVPPAPGVYPDARVFGQVPQLAQMAQGSAAVTVAAYRNTVRSVTVTVRWTAGGSRVPRFRTLTTLVAPKGVAP